MHILENAVEKFISPGCVIKFIYSTDSALTDLYINKRTAG